MNKFFIKSSIDEINMLQDISNDTIKNVLSKHNKFTKSNKIEYEFSKIVDDVINNNINNKQINRFLNKRYKSEKVSNYINIEKDPTSKEYQIIIKKYDEIFDLDKGLSAFDKLDYQLNLAITTPIISIITLYENFVRKLITTDCLEGNSELILNESISFDQLSKLEYDKESVESFLINDYCNNKLFGDKKRINSIIATLSIDCHDCESLIEDFEELYFRRNMYVHGIRNLTKDYLSLPERIIKEWVKDNRLTNTPTYYNHAFRTLKKIILMILIKKCLYKKQDKDDLSTIEEIIYEKIYSKKQYDVACFAYKQLKNLKWITDTQRYFYFVNYMVCLKNLKSNILEEELSKWNTSTDAPIFKLAKKLIQNDYQNINNLILSILKTDSEYAELDEGETDFYITRTYIDEWPLFKDYKTTTDYNLLFNQ